MLWWWEVEVLDSLTRETNNTSSEAAIIKLHPKIADFLAWITPARLGPRTSIFTRQSCVNPPQVVFFHPSLLGFRPMTSSTKKKRERKKDFQKPKLKVGRVKPKPANQTDTSFRAKGEHSHLCCIKATGQATNARI
jgi:hypothetical protein